jgi:DNA modification methylase
MGENSPEKEENEFVSQLEKILPAQEIILPPTLGFGQWAKFFPEEAKTHPAKANLNLINFLILEYTKPGDVILDPMAGTYSTCVLAVLNGRHGIGVELEEKFYKWGLEAKKIVELYPTVVPKGKMVVLQGDARKLSEILKQVDFDAIITSPPYLNDNVKRNSEEFWKKAKEEGKRWGSKPPSGTEDKLMENEENIANLPLGNVDAIITSPPYSEGIGHDSGDNASKEYMERLEMQQKYTRQMTSDGNIAKLKHGNVDIVITSPPYTNRAFENPSAIELQNKGWIKGGDISKFFQNPISEDNLENLSFGNIDVVITSPPYGDTYLGGGNPEKRIERLLQEGYNPKDFVRGTSANTLLEHYGEKRENIGNLPYVDVIISSPPYEASLEGTSRHTRGGIASRDPALAQTGSYATVMSFGVPVGYSPNPDNIGNLKSSDEEYKILIDSIITSPPYAHESTASEPTKLEKEGKFKMGHSKETSYTEENYREWPKHVGGNIGKKKMMVRVPCSPEEADFHDTRPERKGTVWEWTKEAEATPEIVEQIQKQKDEKKGKSETYLEAMLKVYSECYKVLKHGGRAIIIVKPFVRGKRPIDLPYHTWLLMEKVGFKLEKVYKLRLQTKSFWRILYEKRYPEVPKIRHEWVIVARKE